MATWYAQSANDVTTADIWGDDPTSPTTTRTLVSGGSVGAAGDTCDLNGKDMTSSTGLAWTQALITASGATGKLTPAGTLTITGNVTYSGTSTSGMIIVGNSATLTVNGTVTASAAGYPIAQSGTGIVTISNGTSNAVVQSSSGRAVTNSGSGALSVTGNISVTGSGTGVNQVGTSVSHSFTGNISVTGGGTGWNHGNGTLAYTPGSGTSIALSSTGGIGLNISSGTVNCTSAIKTTDTGTMVRSPVLVIGGTLNWTGNVTLAAGEETVITITSGALNLVLQSGAYTPLVITNSGSVVINKRAGTFNTTGNGGAVSAEINCQDDTSYAAIIGGTEAQKGIISYPASGSTVIVIED